MHPISLRAHTLPSRLVHNLQTQSSSSSCALPLRTTCVLNLPLHRPNAVDQTKHSPQKRECKWRQNKKSSHRKELDENKEYEELKRNRRRWDIGGSGKQRKCGKCTGMEVPNPKPPMRLGTRGRPLVGQRFSSPSPIPSLVSTLRICCGIKFPILRK